MAVRSSLLLADLVGVGADAGAVAEGKMELRSWRRGEDFSCEGKKGVGFVFQGSGGLEKMIGNGV